MGACNGVCSRRGVLSAKRATPLKAPSRAQKNGPHKKTKKPNRHPTKKNKKINKKKKKKKKTIQKKNIFF